MKNWLNSLDLKLLEIRNHYGQTYYNGFKRGNLDTNILKELSERKRALLSDSNLLCDLSLILNDTSSHHSFGREMLRKATLLQKLLEDEKVDGSSLLVSARVEVQRRESEFTPSFCGEGKGYSGRRKIPHRHSTPGVTPDEPDFMGAYSISKTQIRPGLRKEPTPIL